jgi:ferredoxin-NADP reductase
VALVAFAHGVTPAVGTVRAISRNPLLGWHTFASVAAPGRDSRRYLMVVSRSGDWTSEFIDHPPSHVWVRGVPTAGMANVRRLFKKVVFVATGSGIGPMLAHLLAGEVPAHLVWVTRNPRWTYGDALVDEILAAQPDATVWDTDQQGRPDVVQLTYDAVRRTSAEAVICIANRQVTWRVVHAMESRGIPANGPIWDS